MFDNFGEPSSDLARNVVTNTRNLIKEVSRRSSKNNSKGTHVPQPEEGRVSQDHNLKQERKYVPIRIVDPLTRKDLHCEHFHEYGSDSHSLTYFRGNQNIPHFAEPILSALREVDVIKSLATESKRVNVDHLGLEWKLTLNSYQAAEKDTSLDDTGGALFPWHTDIPANGEITAIATLLAPAILEFAPYPDAVGEFLNMLVGNASRALEKEGLKTRGEAPTFDPQVPDRGRAFNFVVTGQLRDGVNVTPVAPTANGVVILSNAIAG